MNKKIRRILCSCLLLGMLVSLCPPQPVAAATMYTREQEVVQTIQEVYQASRQGAGVYSFSGYCGSMVAWQLYSLGVTNRLVRGDGKDFYNIYSSQTVTSGGFPVHAYSGTWWSLERALNDITENGTKDAYNIVVGFEATPSQAGSLYGHAILIFGVIDGIVYYNESGPTYPDGLYYPEGVPISCSIADFARRFSYGTLDGLIHFGRRDYTDSCTQYPAYLYAAVTEQAMLYTLPCSPAADERSQVVRSVQPGEYLSIIGLYCNPLGEYWYRVEEPNGVAYVPAGVTRMASMRYEDIGLVNADTPGELRQGVNYGVAGIVDAAYNRVCTVRAQLFSLDGQEINHLCTATQTIDAHRFQLYRSALSGQLGMRELDTGGYRLELAAVVGNHYYADGTVQTDWRTVKLKCVDFQVVGKSYSTYHVVFDAAGGTTPLNEASVRIGDRLASLPQPVRPGYHFAGWFTEDGTQITARTVIADSMTLYAHWDADEMATGWFREQDRWVYLEAGVAVTGLVRFGDMTCCIQDDGTLATGWTELEGRYYYFQPSGALYRGWLERSQGRSYLTEDGAVVGWLELDGARYYFDDQGLLVTGRQTIDGVRYRFGPDGVLQK